MTWKQTFTTRPYSKGRPQFNRKTGNAYTPKNTREYEKLIASLYKGPFHKEGHLSVSIVFTVEGTSITITRLDDNRETSKLTGDVDNYAKAVVDALNGVAYADDKQIVHLEIRKI